MRYISGDQFIHEPDIKAPGDCTGWHVHEFGHTTFVLRGRILTEIGDEKFEMSCTDAVPWRHVPAGVRHNVTLLEEGARVVCVFSKYEGMFT